MLETVLVSTVAILMMLITQPMRPSVYMTKLAYILKWISKPTKYEAVNTMITPSIVKHVKRILIHRLITQHTCVACIFLDNKLLTKENIASYNCRILLHIYYLNSTVPQCGSCLGLSYTQTYNIMVTSSRNFHFSKVYIHSYTYT